MSQIHKIDKFPWLFISSLILILVLPSFSCTKPTLLPITEMPSPVVHRAQEVLFGLENGQHGKGHGAALHKKESTPQLSLFSDKSPLMNEISQLDIDSMSPLEALAKLYELKQKAREKALQ